MPMGFGYSDETTLSTLMPAINVDAQRRRRRTIDGHDNAAVLEKNA
jgi:hypothetical protein